MYSCSDSNSCSCLLYRPKRDVAYTQMFPLLEIASYSFPCFRFSHGFRIYISIKFATQEFISAILRVADSFLQGN